LHGNAGREKYFFVIINIFTWKILHISIINLPSVLAKKSYFGWNMTKQSSNQLVYIFTIYGIIITN
jgi:hypothetical protein